jgi:hypothetical protein
MTTNGIPLRLLLVVTLCSAQTFANPKSKTFNSPANRVYKAALKAAAGNRLVIDRDEGIKPRNDAGEEIKQFSFFTSLPNIAFRVIADVRVQSLPDGTSKVEVFYHKDRRPNIYVPSEAYESRRQQLQARLETQLSALEQESALYRLQNKAGRIDFETLQDKEKDVRKRAHDAKMEELNQEEEAAMNDLAGLPTSSFTAVDSSAEKYFSSIQRNLDESIK